jgi:uncharacterized protein YdhG (YjbR/CyaY superfamily)
MMKPYKTIDEYLDNFPKEVQEILEKIRKIVKEIVPKEAEETISYGIPTVKLNGKYLVYFAGFKNHISLYPIPPVPAIFEKEISPFVKGKGTIQFPLDKPIPYDLIKEFVKYSLDYNLARTSKKN